MHVFSQNKYRRVVSTVCEFVQVLDKMRPRKSLFGQTEWYDAVSHAWGMIEWLVDCVAFLNASDSWSASRCQSLQRSITTHFHPLPTAVCEEIGHSSWWSDRTLEFYSSELLSSSSFQHRISAIISADGEAALKDVIDTLSGIFGTTIGEVKISDWGTDVLERATTLTDTIGLFKTSIEWANSSGDKGLADQLRHVHSLVSLASSAATCVIYTRSTFANETDMVGRKVSADQIAMVRDLASQLDAYSTIASVPNCFDSDHSRWTYHVDIFHTFFPDLPAVNKSVVAEAVHILHVFGASWSADLTALADGIESACPDWHGARDTILDHPDLVSALCDNPDYSAVGPLSAELKSQIKLVKSIGTFHSGALVDAALLSRAAQVADYGVETVAYTFVLWKLTRSWLSIDNQTMAEGEVEELKAKLVPTRVTLCDQLECEIEAWLDGSKVKALQAVRDAPAHGDANRGTTSCSTPAVAPAHPAAATFFMEPGQATMQTMQASSTHAVALAQPAATPAHVEPSAGGGRPQLKRSLVDRVAAAAKARKTC